MKIWSYALTGWIKGVQETGGRMENPKLPPLLGFGCNTKLCFLSVGWKKD